MHAYLLVGTNKKRIEEEVGKIATSNKAEVMEFGLTKISEVRDLASFTRLKVNKKTIIFIDSIENSSNEAQNAFLKNLEEPNENIIYALTTSSSHKLLPTIVSRCQIVRVGESSVKKDTISNVESFLEKSQSEKLDFVLGYRKRDEAVNYITDFIKGCHKLLHSTKNEHQKLASYIVNANQALNNLKANGNVFLQLTNFVVSAENE